MDWYWLDPDLAALQPGALSLEGVSAVGGKIADFAHELMPSERDQTTSMSTPRLAGFSSGRHFARLAMRRLGQTPAAIGRAERAPIWSVGVCGSISHSNSLAVAVVATGAVSVGVDIEEQGRVGQALHSRLLGAEELQRLERRPAHERDAIAELVFSAKEAGYKAIYPLAGEYIGFKEADVTLDEARGRFSIRYLGDHQACRMLDSGQGYFARAREHLLSLFVIPNVERG